MSEEKKTPKKIEELYKESTDGQMVSKWGTVMDKRVTLGFIVTILFQIGFFIWGASAVSTDIQQNAEQTARLEVLLKKDRDSLYKKIDEVRSSIREINQEFIENMREVYRIKGLEKDLTILQEKLKRVEQDIEQLKK